MNDITYTGASDVDPAELAKLNEENALKDVDKGTDAQPVVEHKVIKRKGKSDDESGS